MDVDVAVIGLGAMGSAACATLTARGLRVAGIEQFALGHELGSSAGGTRLIRKAYFEDPEYVPLLERSYTLWRDLKHRAGTPLLDLCGILMIGRESSATIAGVMRSAAAYDIPIEPFDARQVRERFPAFQPRFDEVALLEPEAGIVFAQRAIAAQLDAARDDGAVLLADTRVTRIHLERERIELDLANESSVCAARLVLCAGAWTPGVMTGLRLPLRVERNVQYWFKPESAVSTLHAMPAFYLEREGWTYPFYGMPDRGDGVKCAFHGSGEWTGANELEREVNDREIAAAREALAAIVPDAAGTISAAKACMYTMTPDGNFVLAVHPHDERIVIAAGFSGHGFKFAPVIGEIVADLVTDTEPAFDLRFLHATRF